MSSNGGAWVDERGETEDWVELVNQSTGTLRLSDYWLEDSGGEPVRLPNLELAAREVVVLFADGELEDGAKHLPFKLSSSGERLVLSGRDGELVDDLEVPALGENEVLTRADNGSGQAGRCRYATPGAPNPALCAPRTISSSWNEEPFAPYVWPSDHDRAPAPLALSEVALRPGPGGQSFVELASLSSASVSLDDYELWLSAHAPHLPWPGRGQGERIALPEGAVLEAGGVLTVEVPYSARTLLEGDPLFEGVLTLFPRAGEGALAGGAQDRVDFMQWPVGATLARPSPERQPFVFCTTASPGVLGECDLLPARPVGDRLRHLRTPGDFAALSAGATTVGIQSVKFVMDLEAPGLVHLLGEARWPLHYQFVRELIYRQPALDRCDPVQAAEFLGGWTDFSATEYFQVEGRRFLLGTLSHHGGPNLRAVEYALGDTISAQQMVAGFFAATAHTLSPTEWVLRPQDAEQAARLRFQDGQVPAVTPGSAFENIRYQALTQGTTFGVLRFVPSTQLDQVALGPRVVLVTDDVPNDIPLVGGLITEAPQTPLAHVNVLSRTRGTPNASLRAAREELAPYLERLVRLEVGPVGVQVREATSEEAQSFWVSQGGAPEPIALVKDETVRGVQPLTEHDLSSLPAIGAKAAQLAQLIALSGTTLGCSRAFLTPNKGFAVPVVHSLEHYRASGALDRLRELEATPEFGADPLVRAQGLAEVRARILAAPVDSSLLTQVENAIRARYGQERVRLRSSSNTEDLPRFNGAGLHTSVSAELGDDDLRVDDGLRAVWASLYNTRAYEERSLAGIVENDVAMGVLVHEAFLSEAANGVAVSRDLSDPTRGDIFSINVQAGEASVTNPAPGVTTDDLVYRWYREPDVLYQAQSSLLGALEPRPEHVMSDQEARDVACALRSVHEGFRPLLDPALSNRWFTVQIEFKLVGPDRQLWIKQARPHPFADATMPSDCREL